MQDGRRYSAGRFFAVDSITVIELIMGYGGGTAAPDDQKNQLGRTELPL